MNNKISQIFLAFCLLAAGLFITLSVFAGGGNSIGQFSLYLTGICFLVGMGSPRSALYLLIILCGYSDLIKRFMVLDASVSMLDITYLLALAPMTLAGVVVNRLVAGLFKKAPFRKGDFYRFIFCSGVLGLVVLGAVKSGQGTGSLRVVADYGAFVYLVFVIPMIFKSREGLLRYGRFAVCVFVPVAIYGIYQKIFGISAFEMDYLESGLTVEARQLTDVSIRVFSTLNAATSLTIVMTACVMLTFLLARERYLNKVVALFFILLFAGCGFATLTRTGWVCLIAFPCICFVYRYKFTTFLAYFGGLGSLLLIIIFSGYIMNNLHIWQAKMVGDKTEIAGTAVARSNQALRITTLYDRFLGLNNLKNPKNWQPLGIKRETKFGPGRFDDEAFSHDAISSFIFKRGYIPFAIGLIASICGLFFVHKRILAKKGRARATAAYWAAGVAAMLVSLLGGGIAFQFPANVFLWYLVCVCIPLVRKEDGKVMAQKTLSE